MSNAAPGTPGDAAAAAAAAQAAGAAAAGAQTGENGQPAASAQTGDANAQTPEQLAAAQAAAADQQGDDSPWTDPDKAKREIERLRRENGDARINAKKTAADEARQELLATLTKALNPDAADDTKVTPEQLAQQLADTGSKLGDAAKERAVAVEAWKLGVDPAKLDYLNYTLSRNTEYAGLDANAADLGSKIASVISSEVAKDSTLKLSGAATASGVEQFGGANGASTMTKAEFDRLPYAQRVALFDTNRAEYDRLNNS